MLTMLALLCFLEHGHKAGQGAFSRHVELLLKFVGQAELAALGEAFARARGQVVEAGQAGKPIPGNWLALARRVIIDRKGSAGEAWREICERLA